MTWSACMWLRPPTPSFSRWTRNRRSRRCNVRNPFCRWTSATPERRTHNYVRHGTLDLFAALNVATGEVLARCTPQHRAQDFVAFLREIDAVAAVGGFDTVCMCAPECPTGGPGAGEGAGHPARAPRRPAHRPRARHRRHPVGAGGGAAAGRQSAGIGKSPGHGRSRKQSGARDLSSSCPRSTSRPRRSDAVILFTVELAALRACAPTRSILVTLATTLRESPSDRRPPSKERIPCTRTVHGELR